MKKILLFLVALLVTSSVIGQVSAYTFSQSSGSFIPIAGGTVLGTGTIDDNVYNANNIGFSFYFNGTYYTQFSVNVNGWICMGATAVSSYTPISTGTSNNVISAVGRDIQGIATGELRYQVLGTTPNQTLVIQWLHFSKYGSTGTGDDWNFQIRLNETSNTINIVYGAFTVNATSTTVQVGLRGASNADYNNRNTTTDWAATTAGTINSASCNLSNTVYPASGQTFTYTSPPPPPNIVYMPLMNTASLNVRTLTATITSLSGIPTSGIGLPVLYWKKNAGTYSSAQGVSIGSNNYNFTFGAGVVAGDVISYYICAQDMAGTPNVACAPSAGAAGLTYNPPAAGTPPTTPSSYTILAGTLCGTFNVGVGQTYTTLTAAITALNNSEITCPVTFILTDATYSASESFPIILNNVAGSNATNTITIKPGAGVSPTISGTSANGIFVLWGTQYLTIDGSNSSGVDRSLTFQQTNTISGTYCFGMFNNGIVGASNCTIKNCKFLASTQVTNTTYAFIFNALGGGYTNDIVQNNQIYSAYEGMQFAGVAGNPVSNCQVINNTIGSTVDATALDKYGIFMTQANNCLVANNEIMGGPSGNTNFSQVGLYMSTGITNAKIRANKIHDWFYSTLTGGWGNWGIYYAGDASTVNEISNNLIYNIKADSYTSGLSVDNLYGVYITTGGNIKFYHNSINMQGSVTSSTYVNATACLAINSGVTLMDVENNIFKNSLLPISGAPASFTYDIQCGGTASTFSNLNYNDYWDDGNGPNIGYLGGTQYATLAAWKTATSMEANGINVNPLFTSATNLVPTTTLMNNAGIYIQLVPTDYAGTVRSNPPDIGAYEYAADPLVNTTAATAISTTTATLNGTINANTLIVNSFFDYGLTTAYGSTVAGVPASVSGTTLTTISAAISGLTLSTLYHFRARGVTTLGVTMVGPDLTFTTATPTIPPTVVTTVATGVTATTATLNGTVNANTLSTTTSFDYGLTITYGTSIPGIPLTVIGNTATPVLANLTGLIPGTTYHYRINGVSASGTSNGNDMTFTTLALAPTLITYPATAINTTIATLNGLVTANGSSTTVWFDYGPNVAYGTTVAATPATVTGNIGTAVSASLTGLTNGATYHYRVRGTNAIGTTNGNDVTFVTGCFVAGPAGPITGPTQVCQGGCGYVYSVVPIANASGYNWTVPIGGTITAGANTNTITVCYSANASPGYIFVYGTASCGNGAPSQLAIAMNPPAAPTLSGPASACVNSTGNVYTTQTNMSNYVWTVSAGGTITAGGTSTSNTVTVKWITAGAQTVSVNYNTAAGCPALTPTVYNVTVYALPLPIIAGPNPACSNYPGLVYTTQPNMTGYTWTISAGGTFSGQGTNAITVTWNTTGAQNLSVNYTNANGCTAAAPVVYPVTVNSGAAPIITGSTTVCVNSGYYNYTTEAGMTAYTWTISPGGVINFGGGTNVITVSWVATGAQWVKVNYTNTFGCQAYNPTQLNITVNPLPGPAGSITGTATVCGGATGVAYSVAAVAGASNYVWSLPAGASIASGANTNFITVNFATNASSGNITVYGNNICGNGAASPPFAVTVNPIPAAAGNITGPASVCQCDAAVVYMVPAIAGATSYIWTVPAGATIVSGANTNSITVDFCPAAVSGNITVLGTNSCGNGTVSPNFAVTVHPIPAAPVVTNTGYILYSSAPTGNQWYFEGTLIQGATAQTYDATLTGTGYYWSVVTLNGCSSDTSNHKLVITTGIDSHSSSTINIYPVPNDGRFNVFITTASSESFSISIYNSLGVKIYEETKVNVNGSLQKVIDLRPVPNGVYTVIFENSQNQVVKKIIVNK